MVDRSSESGKVPFGKLLLDCPFVLVKFRLDSVVQVHIYCCGGALTINLRSSLFRQVTEEIVQ